jgi:eukaryotic-like serine/threonine-protein kinase
MSTSTSRIDRYELQEIIGRGAMGVVYLARDPAIGRVVALKTIQIPEGTEAVARGESIERFAREARAAGLLSHPNIVTVYDVGSLGEQDGTSYIAMEFVEGRTLRQMVPHGERLDPERVLDIAMQVARGLDYAHRRGVVHRDVKPANILVRDDGLVKLADFGVARLDASDLTRTGESVGSPSYISPEMLLGHPVDGRADIFSLGVLVYEMLTGSKPFVGDSLAALYHQTLSIDPPPPSRADPEIGSAWDAVVARMLAKRPESRYPSAAELLEDLRSLQAGRPPRLVPEPPAERSAPLTLAEPESIPEPVLDRVIADGMRDSSRPTPIAPAAKALVAFVTVTGFALFIILGAYLFRPPEGNAEPAKPAPAARAPAAPVVEPADVQLRLAHNLRSGRLGLIVDGKPLFTAPFKGEKGRLKAQGAMTRMFQVPPGRHVFKVTVADDSGRTWSGIATRRVEADANLTLFVEVKGILRRSLDLTWY